LAWDGALVDGLCGAGHTPVLVDLPGHGRNAGRTDPAFFTLEATLASIVGAGAWPADLIGYSLGGRIALHFAAAFPGRIRRLVLESASPGLGDDTERTKRRLADEALAERLVEGGIEAFVDHWESLSLFETQERLDPELLHRQRGRRLGNDAAALAAALRGLGAGTLPHLWDRLPEVRVPTLLIAGASDTKFAEIARRMAERMPRACVVVVPDSGHAVHLERPDAWLSAVTDFLGR
jgi:2-succinyl-6-hydroxy-2,4-cyclohexadiene-1-carboxylate synthase